MNLFLFTPHMVFIGTVAVVIGVFWFLRFTRRGRRTPLTRQLLRMPGETLRRKIDDLGDDLSSYLFVTIAFPLLFYSVYLASSLAGKASPFTTLLYTISPVVAVLFIIIKMWKIAKEIDALRLGLDCELAVGQELNQLMLEGCRVYHDFPAENFNIDHVVVGPGGVYAMETKGRGKPDKKMDGKEATVTYNGQTLKFPGWIETEPIDQARRQAEWLSKWLTSAVGEDISVQPVLSFPGWFVEREIKDDLIFLYGKPTFLAQPFNNKALPGPLIQRIAHQLEQRCRDVEPVAYSNPSFANSRTEKR